MDEIRNGSRVAEHSRLHGHQALRIALTTEQWSEAEKAEARAWLLDHEYREAEARRDEAVETVLAAVQEARGATRWSFWLNAVTGVIAAGMIARILLQAYRGRY